MMNAYYVCVTTGMGQRLGRTKVAVRYCHHYPNSRYTYAYTLAFPEKRKSIRQIHPKYALDQSYTMIVNVHNQYTKPLYPKMASLFLLMITT